MIGLFIVSVILAFLLLCVTVITFLVQLIRRKSKKPAGIMLLCCIGCLAVSFVLSSIASSPANNEPSGNNISNINNNNVTSGYTQTESFAGEFCMAYMNNLKNPYSFKVKYAWALDKGDGTYQVYIKYTAENSFGADVAGEIASMSVLNKSDLKKIAQGGQYVSILTWEGEPSGKIIGEGQDLNAARIQAYIDQNYD